MSIVCSARPWLVWGSPDGVEVFSQHLAVSIRRLSDEAINLHKAQASRKERHIHDIAIQNNIREVMQVLCHVRRIQKGPWKVPALTPVLE